MCFPGHRGPGASLFSLSNLRNRFQTIRVVLIISFSLSQFKLFADDQAESFREKLFGLVSFLRYSGSFS